MSDPNRARVEQAVRASAAPIAVVGVGCRFPGGVADLESYWRLLIEGVDAIGPVPTDRWDADALYGGPEPMPGRIRSRSGGFLDEIARFDADFFGISPREAVEMDPAQRILLEVAWEALEDAGLPTDRLEGSRTGVYVGLGLSDYSRRHFGGSDRERISAWSGTGSFLSVAAGRISYALGLQGPALVVDTACSSSLVAVHLAVQGLRQGETDCALAGGANLVIAPEPSIAFSQLQALSPDGRCKSFDASADGYGRGEGCGVIVLKRLSDAERDGDRVLAVIRGTAVNQDGRSNGLTAPSGRAQQQVIRAALEDGGIPPEEVGYLEAHGTGTPLGDPIELGAIRAVFGDRPPGASLAIGSAKTNFGHLETAAGVASLLKALLVLRERTVPPHLHLRELNPRIRLGAGTRIPTEPTPLEGRLAGVSAFGLSGTNAHVVLEAGPVRARSPAAEVPVVLPISARSPEAVRALAGELAGALERVPAVDLASSLIRRRSALPHRASVAGIGAELVPRLQALAAGGPVAEVRGRPPELVFAFTGQGAQLPGMGSALYRDADFQTALDEVAALLDPHLDRPIREVLFEGGAVLDDTRYTQPGLFALQVALVRWWAARGVVPDAVVGHSIGEYAAVWASGGMTLQDAARLVCARGRRMAELPTGGAMLAVLAPEAVAAPFLDEAVQLAAVNGPTEAVLSGDQAAIEAAAVALEARGVRVRRLTVSHAFHSARMEPMVAGFAQDLDGVRLTEGEIPFARTGGPAEGTAYWVEQIRRPVRFADAVERLIADGFTRFLEIGPRAVLSGMGARIGRARWIPSLGGQDELVAVRTAAGALFEEGVEVRLDTLVPERPPVRLPTMPWRGERHWMELPEVGADPLHGLVWEVQWTAAWPSAAPEIAPWVAVGVPDPVVEALEGRGCAVRRLGWSEPVEAAERVLLGVSGTVSLEARLTVASRWLTRPAGRTWLVTEGVSGREPSVDGAALAGLVRVAARELPDRVGGWVDAVEADPEAVAEALLGAGELQTRVVGARREVARLRPCRRAHGGVWEPREGTWLVTGGFGALGSEVARWLVERGVRSLVLVGRRGEAHPDAERILDELRGAGATVGAVAADLAEAEAVAELLAGIPHLAGVVHAAGVLADGRLAGLDEGSAAAVLGPKLRAAEHLAAATETLDLDALVLFSSAAAALGNPGQGAYAAANAGLDALATRLRGQGRRALSVGWGPWSGAGMGAVSPQLAQEWERTGIRTLDPREALGALQRLLGAPVGAVVAAPFDWSRLAAERPARDGLLRDFAAAAPVVRRVGADWLGELAQAAAPTHALADRVRAIAAAVLGRADPAGLDPEQGFFEAGMDSLMAVELRNRLQDAVGRPLPATVAFDHPSVDRLARWLADEVLELSAPSAPVAARASASDEPIAVIGAACRMPGAADLEELAALLWEGIDPIGPVPDGRFDADALYDPAPGTPGRLYAREAGYVRGLEDFDPELFGITRREARVLDPQQRLLLEVGWAALEDAAVDPTALKGSATGVFVGIGASEYGRRFDPLDAGAEPDPYAGTGNESSFAAGRLAHALGLRGPALAVNTACSSSLVALHLAAAALREGSCELALAGGANAIAAPDVTVQLSQIRALSPTSRCRTFDIAADGYARAEGCGVVVLARLRDALAAGWPIRAVLAGSAVNHDGAAAGLTVPSGPAQVEVVRAALDAAGVQPREVDWVECHGTGTALGDPIEVGALREVFRGREAPLTLTAVKAHVGHLEAAAGMAGLLQVVLGLERERIPGQLHLRETNPELPLEGFPARIATEGLTWSGADRVAGVSSFGLSGTNAHAVLRAPPTVSREPVDSRSRVLVLSGHTPAAVRARTEALRAWLQRAPRAVEDVVATCALSRGGLVWRTSAVVGADEPIDAALARMLSQEPVRTGRPRVGWLFTGQGSQWPGMGAGPYGAFPAFREAVDAVAAIADPQLGGSLVEVLCAEGDERIHDTRWTQPALYAYQVGLAQLWASWGHRPERVTGHSIGLFAAAAVAGVFSVEDGARLAVARGLAMGALPREGRMVAIRATEAAAVEALAGLADVAVAAVNGPEAVVISGAREGIETALRRLGEVEPRELRTSHAFHSPLMEPALAAFEAVAREVAFGAPRVPVIETVRGESGAELGDPAWWARHIVEPVRFEAALRALAREGIDTLVELGPHPVLLGMAARLGSSTRVPCARRDEDGERSLLEAVGALYTSGAAVDLKAVNGPGRRIHLPTLPLQRTRCWVDLPTRRGALPDLAAVGWAAAPASAGTLGPGAVIGSGPVADALVARGWTATTAEGAAAHAEIVDLRQPGVAEAVALCQAAPDSRVHWVASGATAAALSGLVATALLEGVRAQLVEVDDAAPERVVEALARPEERLRIRAGRIEQPRWEAVAAGPVRPLSGTWWITGGLGDVGLALARILTERGADRVLAIGRSGKARDPAALERVLAEGVPLVPVAADVSRAEDLDALLAEHGEPEGAIHAAGVLQDHLIRGLTPEAIEAVLAPKLRAAELLDARLPAAELIFCSSVAGVLGSVGQAAYAAANAGLDALAERRRARGRPALSIAWGPFAVGMAERVDRDWAGEGVRPLTVARAGAFFDAARSGERAAVIAADLDLPTWASRQAAVPAWLGLDAPSEAQPLDRAAIADRVLEATAAVLGREPGQVDPGQGFFEAGFDSLLAVELVERLQRSLGRPLPRTLVFEHGSPRALAEHLVGAAPTVEVLAPRPIGREPIAVIGMACRYPGADSPEAFWELLRDGRDEVREIPADRWPAGRTAIHHGAFLDGIDRFDAELFGISPREAAGLDPQQRLLLEVGWEAFERAGRLEGLRESRTGVFAGVAESDYLQRFRRAGEPFYADTYAGSGNEGSFPAGRLSYILGLQGPAVSLNTACSSSLVATHLACNSLRLGECDLALAVGVSLMLAPDNHLYLAQLGALSPTGRCHTFDAGADGYVRGEGCGALVLKRLTDAVADGDRVLAVIRGSAVNHDGPSSGLTVPNGSAQQRVIREALAAAGVAPAEVDVLEAHGTGTPLGDPVEVRAADAVLGQGREGPLILGSVKTNLGHLEQAAAMAGIHKLILAMQHGQIPAHLHLNALNPELEGVSLSIPSRLTPWQRRGPRRIGAVSSFGISGTNGHLILEEAPPAAPAEPPIRAPFAPISGHTPAALAQTARELGAWMRAHPDAGLPEVAATRWLSRAQLRYRATVSGSERAAALQELERIATEPPSHPTGEPRLALLFTGQGSQVPAMGAGLYAAEPVFREVVDRCAEAVAPLLDRSLVQLLTSADEAVHHTRYTQPALYAVECALAALWEHRGVRPEAVLGHSIGQLAAATSAGVWSLETGAVLAARRGALMGVLPPGGRMIAVRLDEEPLAELLLEHPRVSLAAVNAPGECVLSGEGGAVDAIEAALRERGVEATGLNTSHAFHSALMEPAVAAFAEAVSRESLTPPGLTLVANATGAIAGAAAATPGFWADAIREPVRFAAGVRTLAERGFTHFLEVGPHPVLGALVQRTAEGATCIASARRDRDPLAQLDEATAALWTAGVPLDARRVLGVHHSPNLPLPTTPFQRRRHWLDAPEFPELQRGVPLYRVALHPGRTAVPTGRTAVLGDPSGLAGKLFQALAGAELADPEAIPDGVARVVDCRPLALDPEAGLTAGLTLAHAAMERDLRVFWLASAATAHALAGFARVLAEEHEGLAPTVLSVAEPPDVSWLIPALGCDPAVRSGSVGPGGLEVERLLPIETPAPELALDPEGAWLITGGMGDLGLHTARWLADRGARHLWLVGRRGPREGALPALAALRERGVAVHPTACDAADPVALDALLDRIRAERSLVGVVHAAGVLDDGLVRDQTPERARLVFAPKLDAARNLDRATRGDPLAHFVLYSSAAAILGLPGQAVYAAANGALDGLARARRAEGLPATSVQWGPWSGSGMVEGLDASVRDHQRRLGIGHLDPDDALASLGAALASGEPVVAALSVDWTANLAQYAGRAVPDLLRELAPDAPSEVAAPDALPELVARVRTLPKTAWTPAIEAFLEERVNAIQRAPADRPIDRERPLWDMGMDSMMTVELRNLLIGAGVRLKVARLIGGPSISEIAGMALAELEQHPALAAPAPTPEAPTPAEEPPLDPVWSHLGAAFGGALAAGILGFLGWQIWTIVLGGP